MLFLNLMTVGRNLYSICFETKLLLKNILNYKYFRCNMITLYVIYIYIYISFEDMYKMRDSSFSRIKHENCNIKCLCIRKK